MPRPLDIRPRALLAYLGSYPGAIGSSIVAAVYCDLPRATAYRHVKDATTRGYILRANCPPPGDPHRMAECPHGSHVHHYVTPALRIEVARLDRIEARR